MQFIQFPAKALFEFLTNTDRVILLYLIQRHFTFCGSDFKLSFYITDRDLASVVGCSSSSVYHAKRRLTETGFIRYQVGPKNTTWYEIIEQT